MERADEDVQKKVQNDGGTVDPSTKKNNTR